MDLRTDEAVILNELLGQHGSYAIERDGMRYALIHSFNDGSWTLIVTDMVEDTYWKQEYTNVLEALEWILTANLKATAKTA